MEWTLIYTTNDPSESVVIQSVLESEGIEFKVTKESIADMYNISVDGLGEIKIYVHEDKAKDAKELLDSKNSSLPDEK